MKLKGRVFTGVLRGKSLITLYGNRIRGLIGYPVFKGTLDVRLEKPIDITLYTTKKVEHILLDGDVKVDLYLAPIRLYFKDKMEDCWAGKQGDGIYPNDVIEIIARENLREKMDIKDGDEVEIEFLFEKKKSFLDKLLNIFKRSETRLMR